MIVWHQRLRLLFELDLIAQRDPVGARRGSLRLQGGTAAVIGLPLGNLQYMRQLAIHSQRQKLGFLSQRGEILVRKLNLGRARV